MKWLFALLLLVNLGLFLWGYRHDPMTTAQPALPVGAGIGNLRLLSELQSESAPATPEAAAAETAPAEPETPMVGLPLPPIEPEMETAEGESAASAEPPTGEPVPEEPAPPKPAVAGPPVERCGSLGVIEDRQQARKIEQELQQPGVKVTLEEEVKQAQLGFWVVIPPLPDNEAAQQKLQELAAVGITDVWHFKNGDMKNAISLGMFSQESNAQNFQQEMQQRGFDTELRPRYLNKKQYTVQVQIKAPQSEADAAWRRIKQQYPDLHLSNLACGQIASP